MPKRSDARHDGQGARLDEERQALVDHHESLRMARYLARRAAAASPNRYPLSAMMAEAQEALRVAAQRFDPGRGVPFSRYARPLVRARVFRVARSGGSFQWLLDDLRAMSPAEREAALSSGSLQRALRRLIVAYQEATALLSEDQRAVMQAYFVDGKTLSRIARGPRHHAGRGCCAVRKRSEHDPSTSRGPRRCGAQGRVGEPRLRVPKSGATPVQPVPLAAEAPAGTACSKSLPAARSCHLRVGL